MSYDYKNFRAIMGSFVDTEAILAEAMEMSGPTPSVDLLLALSIKAIDAKYHKQIDDIKQHIFVDTEVDLPELPPVIDLSGARHMKQADANLGEAIDAMNGMTQEQLYEFDRREAAKVALNDPTITLAKGPEEYDSKDIYLRTKIGVSDIYQIVGLHAVGHAGPYSYTLDNNGVISQVTTNFMALETWGNEYDDEHNMLGRGSFRLHSHDIDAYAKEMVAEGWEIYPGPKRKDG